MNNLNTKVSDEAQSQPSCLGDVILWVAVTEKMPIKNVTVIAYFPDGDESGNKVATAITYNGKDLRSDFPNSTSHCFKATHWLPLPEPPCL